MKIGNALNRVHILNKNTDVWNVLQGIVESEGQEDAFYVCDIGDVIRKHKIWNFFLPRVEPYYAVKCNDNLAILEVLANLGTGFDCASKGEINKILSLGIESSRIIFANPAKPASHIRHAAAVGVDMMTFDNETELHKIKTLFPNARCDAKVAQCIFGMKFGCDPITEAPHLLEVARDLELDVVGVSFHVGSGCGEPDAFHRAIASAREVFDYATSLGFKFNFLDIGGGYPGRHQDPFEPIAKVINKALDEYFPDPSIRIIAEPGRFYVTSAYTLVCNVHSIRTVRNGDSLHYMYYINDGVYGSFNCILYEHREVIPQPLKAYQGSKLYSSSIWGPTCDGLDQVVEACMLPELKIGDWIVFEDMGAYTLPVASPFNGFPVPKVHFIFDEHIWLMMKDILPLKEEHFTFGNSHIKVIANFENDDDDYITPQLPISLCISKHNDDSVMQEHILELVEVDPIE